MEMSDELPDFGKPRPLPRLTPEDVHAMDEGTKASLLLQREATISKLMQEIQSLRESIDRLEQAIMDTQEEAT